jgi:uncharacterized membrane protein
MMHWYGPWSGTAWLGMALMMLLWASVIGLAVWGIARSTSARPEGHPESARDVLDRRLAAGEIDAEEYAHARHLLEHHEARRGTPA